MGQPSTKGSLADAAAESECCYQVASTIEIYVDRHEHPMMNMSKSICLRRAKR